MAHIIPEGYQSILDLRNTQQAIKTLKNCFQQQLGAALNLTRVSAPLFVSAETGLNDDLSGKERKVTFDVIEDQKREIQVVQSLAKWKRDALGRYQYPWDTGLYTDMNAIRRDETTDNTHSIYVDQWDWEKVIHREERTLEYLYNVVNRIHAAVLEAETVVHSRYPCIQPRLPQEVAFITAQELYELYPTLTADERENVYAKKHGAIFVSQIGWNLPDGTPHSMRAPDYDDWGLNGDLVYYDPELKHSVEISSMGIRVDASSLFTQLQHADAKERLEYPFHQKVMCEQLPLTIGGGIGQSRLCMLLLRKAHIGEVQCSVWPDEVIEKFEKRGIMFL